MNHRAAYVVVGAPLTTPEDHFPQKRLLVQSKSAQTIFEVCKSADV